MNGKTRLLTAVVVALQAMPATADFHLVAGSGFTSGQYAVASNKYYCLGLDASCKNCHATVVQGDLLDAGSNYFQLESGLCGASVLDLYRDGNEFKIYEHNGDGSVQGVCYPNNRDGIWCGVIHFSEHFVCYSYLCK
jgi:hypothetical protein